MNISKCVFVVFILLLLVSPCGTVYSQVTSLVDTVQEEEETAADANWKEDFDKRIDATIQILNVVKEEINEDDVDTVKLAVTQDSEDEDASLKDSVRTIIRKTGRVWKKVKEIVSEDEDPEDEAVEDAREAAENKELSKKIETTIDIMQVMKEELDNLRDDDPEEEVVPQEEEEGEAEAERAEEETESEEDES